MGGGLDGSAYRRRAFSSVHVGQLLFERFAEGARAEVLETKSARKGKSDENGEAAPGDASGAGEESPTPPVAEAEYRRGAELTEDLQRPTITVLLPVKDGGDRLLDAVESVVACSMGETPPDWQLELLIIDDGSRDDAVDRAAAAVASVTAVDYPAGDAGRAGIGMTGGGAVGKAVMAVAAMGMGRVGDGQEEIMGGGEKMRGGGVEERVGYVATAETVGGRREEVLPGGDGGERCEVGVDTPAAATVAATAAAANAATDAATAAATVGAATAGGEQADRRCTLRCSADGRRSNCVLKIIRHEQTLGLAESLNEGLREARGDLVARMDADDVCMPRRLIEQVSKVEAGGPFARSAQ